MRTATRWMTRPTGSRWMTASGWGPSATLVSHPVAGQPALLGFIGRELAGVLVFMMRDDKIQAVHVIADPRQLGFLSAQLG
jgi:hypothetical protein